MTSSPMTTTSPPDLAFAQVREDPAIEAGLLAAHAAALGRGARVLLVASGGCTALSLLLRPPGEVARLDAVDPAPAQRHLVELKLGAARTLTRDEAHRLLGVTPADAGARRALYARVRPTLSPLAREHWDARGDQVARGVMQGGRFEALFREFAAAFRDDGLDPLARPAEALADPGWRARFERVFERQRLEATFGRAAVAYSMDRSFGEHFADVFARALRRHQGEGAEPPWPGENYFLRQVWEDRYLVDAPRGLPDWLAAPERLVAPERLHLHAGRFQDLFDDLARAHGPYDLVQTSNISDWMPVPELEALVARVAARLAPGGLLLMRRLNGDHDLAAIVGRHLRVDRAECEALRRDDRSFFYREVVVGRAAR